MSLARKVLIPVVLVLIVLAASWPFFSTSSPAQAQSEALPGQDGPQEASCETFDLSLKATDTIQVPAACHGDDFGLCKLVLYTDANMGTFADGYSWEVYYRQWDDTNTWIGGPNVSMGGVSFSDGKGTNGDGIGQGVFLGRTLADGGYIRIMDDGEAENDPGLWTIESRASQELTRASLQVCGYSDYWTYNNPSNAWIIMPNFCVDHVCMIMRYTEQSFGDFGPGLSLPVYYQQDGVTNEWIGGPHLGVYGMTFSAGQGKNGPDNSSMTPILDGGTTVSGSYIQLLDDGAEWDSSQWSIRKSDEGDLTNFSFYIVPMSCEKHSASWGHSTMDVPNACVGALCTVLRWTDGTFGAFSKGLSWPSNYIQALTSGQWFGGPAINFAGVIFSDGEGLNGNDTEEMIFHGGETTSGGYARLMDDSALLTNTPEKWVINFFPQDDLTAADFYVCTNTCQETNFMINKQYLPLTLK